MGLLCWDACCFTRKAQRADGSFRWPSVRQRGLFAVHLHARANVVGFYERLGYETYGEPFEEVGLPHRHMRRTLSP
jgi:hypothetical protein